MARQDGWDEEPLTLVEGRAREAASRYISGWAREATRALVRECRAYHNGTSEGLPASDAAEALAACHANPRVPVAERLVLAAALWYRQAVIATHHGAALVATRDIGRAVACLDMLADQPVTGAA